MINNFSHIGFFSSKEDFSQSLSRLINAASKEVSYVEKDGVKLIDYRDRSGAGLKIIVDKDNSLVSVLPFFIGNSVIGGNAIRIIYDKDYMEGGFVMNCNDNGTEFPIYWNSKDILDLRNINLPQSKKVQVSAFPREIKFFQNINEPDFTKTNLTEKSLIPTGLFTSSASPMEKPEAVLSGVIKEIKGFTNNFSGLDFLSLKVETLGGMINIVCDLSLINDSKPEVGNIVAGQFWLSGNFVNDWIL